MIAPRRAFVRGLATLSLIGGGVTLPTAVAVPVTASLLELYIEWLAVELGECFVERTGRLHPEIHAATHWRRAWCRDIATLNPRGARGLFVSAPAMAPSTRAALVLSTVGVDWKAPYR